MVIRCQVQVLSGLRGGNERRWRMIGSSCSSASALPPRVKASHRSGPPTLGQASDGFPSLDEFCPAALSVRNVTKSCAGPDSLC
eukprot:673711-Hanusia_phi.AAC.1